MERIQQRIRGRQYARECLEIYDQELTEPHVRESFVDEILSRLCPKQPEPEVLRTPIARLGQLQMVFGAHKGKPFDDIPLEYLDWLCRTQEDFYKSLREYLRHPDLQSRRGHEGA